MQRHSGDMECSNICGKGNCIALKDSMYIVLVSRQNRKGHYVFKTDTYTS